MTTANCGASRCATTACAPAPIAVTSYAEVVLAPQRADIAHPGFSNLFIQTEFLPESGALLATRRPRSSHERAGVGRACHRGHRRCARAPAVRNRPRTLSLVAGAAPRLPQVMQHGQALSNTTGNVLDPIFSLRTQVVVPARQQHDRHFRNIRRQPRVNRRWS